MPNESKTCSKCQKVLDFAEFATDRSKAIGRKSICRECDRAKSRRYYAANRERVIHRVLLRKAVRERERERAA